MDYLRQVQRGIDYIEAHLDADVETAEVARHAGISHWHFQRIFKALTNETLKTYIRSRRLADALDALSTTDTRVIDVALASGFESQEAFTRAFKKAFGITPAAFRKTGHRFQFLRKLRFDADYLSHLHKNLSLEPEMVEQPEMTLVGMSTRFFSVDSEKNNIAKKLPALWGQFLPKLGDIPHRVVGHCHGVVRQTAEQADELVYSAAAPVSRLDRLPKGMVEVVVPAARYAKFTHVGPVATIDRTVSYIYSSWLARSGMRHTYGADLEFYDARYHPESETSVIEYAIPVESG